MVALKMALRSQTSLQSSRCAARCCCDVTDALACASMCAQVPGVDEIYDHNERLLKRRLAPATWVDGVRVSAHVHQVLQVANFCLSDPAAFSEPFCNALMAVDEDVQSKRPSRPHSQHWAYQIFMPPPPPPPPSQASRDVAVQLLEAEHIDVVNAIVQAHPLVRAGAPAELLRASLPRIAHDVPCIARAPTASSEERTGSGQPMCVVDASDDLTMRHALTLLAQLPSINELRLTWGQTGRFAPSHKIALLAELTQLERLTISRDAASLATTAIPHMGSLTALTLLDLSSNCIGDRGAATLSRQLRSLLQLRHLRLNSIGISDPGMEELAPSLPCAKLSHLELEGNRIRDRGTACLADSVAQLDALRCMQYHGNPLGDHGAHKLISKLPGASLVLLRLSAPALTNTGAVKIASELTRLSRLVTCGIHDSRASMEALLSGQWLAPVACALSLSGQVHNPISVSNIVERRIVNSLQLLELGDVLLDDTGSAAALSHLTGLTALTYLGISFASVGGPLLAAELRLRRHAFAALQHLGLYFSAIAPACASSGFGAALATLTGLTSLSLMGTPLAGECAAVVGELSALPRLAKLDLRRMKVDDACACSLAMCVQKLSSLLLLLLGDNAISARGVDAVRVAQRAVHAARIREAHARRNRDDAAPEARSFTCDLLA